MTTRPPTPCGSGPVQCKFAVQPGLLTQPPPGASAICCNTWLQLAGPSHGAMQIRCAVRLCNLAPRPARHWLNFRRPLHCGCVSRRSPLRLRFAKRLQFRQARLAPNSCLPSARSLHFRHRTARPKPAGPVRWLVSAARRRQILFEPIHHNPASPTRTTPPRPTPRWPAHLPSLLRKRSQARWPSLRCGHVPAWTKPVAPPCSVLVHSIGLDFGAPATVLVPARLGLRAESSLCREPRTQHGSANHAAPAPYRKRRRSLDCSTR